MLVNSHSLVNTCSTCHLPSRMQKCSAIWVCADITRAVDNKTAKDLLGESFRWVWLSSTALGRVKSRHMVAEDPGGRLVCNAVRLHAPRSRVGCKGLG